VKKISILISLIIILFSCINFNEVIVPNYASGLENIKHNLEKEKIDLFEAYIEVNKYMEKYGKVSKENKQAQTFLEDIYMQIGVKLTEYFDQNNFEDALRYALSLETINKKPDVPVDLIYSKLSDKMDASSDIFNQIDVREEMADRLIYDNKKVYELLKIYEKNKSRGDFLYHFEKYTKSYPNLLNEYPGLIDIKKKMEDLNDLNFEELMKSVVVVILDKGINVKEGMKFYDKGLGTGFLIDDKGYILTNHHVIADHVDPKYEGFTSVKVYLKDNLDVGIPAKVVGYDKVFDIALLKIPIENKNYLSLGRSRDIEIGDKIYTIGNPLGLQYTVTSGIISNKNINVFQLGRCFMIDAATNPGNSGGPLIDDRGQVIGIVFAKIPQFENINFAIPFEWVRKTITALYNGGEVKRCWIGSGIYNNKGNVNFYYIMPNGPASKAGITEGDRLVKIDGVDVESVEHAQSLLAWRRYPRLLEIEVERGGKMLKKVVRLEKRPYMPVKTIFDKDVEANIIKLVFGIEIEYYDKAFFMKKYVTKKVYKVIQNSILSFDLDIGEGDPITVYDLKYIEKDDLVTMRIRYKPRSIGVADKVIGLVSTAGINTIL